MPGHIAVNPVTNQIYVSTLNEIGNGPIVNVAVIDGSTNSITATVSIPQLISTLAVCGLGEKCGLRITYENSPGNATMAAINGATNTVTATLRVGYNDNTFALKRNDEYHPYVPDAHGNQMYVIDGATLAITTAIPWPNTLTTTGLAINPVTNTIYVTGYLSSSLVVQAMNGATNTICQHPQIHPSPSYEGLMVNSVTNQVWQVSSPRELSTAQPTP